MGCTEGHILPTLSYYIYCSQCNARYITIYGIEDHTIKVVYPETTKLIFIFSTCISGCLFSNDVCTQDDICFDGK